MDPPFITFIILLANAGDGVIKSYRKSVLCPPGPTVAHYHDIASLYLRLVINRNCTLCLQIWNERLDDLAASSMVGETQVSECP